MKKNINQILNFLGYRLLFKFIRQKICKNDHHKNSPEYVAEIFTEILYEFDGIVNYYFAIMTTNNDNYIIINHDKANIKTINILIKKLKNKLL